MPIIGGGSIIPGDGGIAPTTDDTRSGGGGGGANDPSIDPTIDAADLTINGTEVTTRVELTNSGSTPASVELSFSSLTAGGETLLVGLEPDDGTPTSPTYVIDPDTDIKIITLARGDLTPSSPSSPETVTFTSNAGALPQPIAYTVEPLSSQVHELIRAFSAPVIPSYEFKYDGNFVNTGSIGGTSTASSMTATSLPTPEGLSYAGFVGYGETTASGSHHDINNVPHSTTLRNADRSWIYAFHIVTETSTGRVSLLHGTNSRSGPGWLATSGTIFRFTYVASISGNSRLDLNASHNHTDGGASVACTRANNRTVLICASYDHSAGTTTYRWKRSGEEIAQGVPRAGHSYKVVSGIGAQTASGSSRCTFAGYSSGSYYKVRHLNTTIVDSLISADAFNEIANAMGL